MSDAGVAGLDGPAAGEGAYYNVRINLPGIKDEVFKTRVREEAEALQDGPGRARDAVRDIVAMDAGRLKEA